MFKLYNRIKISRKFAVLVELFLTQEFSDFCRRSILRPRLPVAIWRRISRFLPIN